MAAELPYERHLRRWMEHRGMAHERLQIQLACAAGETVAYRLRPSGKPGAVVLALHGAGNDALFGFPGLFKRLLQAGVEVFTLDLPGHGRASTTAFAPRAALGVVAEATEMAQEGRAALPLHALGVSLGGSLLLGALPSVGDRLDTAVLVSAPLEVRFSTRAVLNELRPPLLAAALRQRQHVGLTGLIPSFGPFKRGHYPLRLDQPRPGAFGYVGAINELLDELDLHHALEGVSTPTLLVHGSRDRLVPIEQAAALARRLPHAELLEILGGTHLSSLFHPLAQRAVVERLSGQRSARSVR